MFELQLVVLLFVLHAVVVTLEEPTCLSRFDYDYKMLTKLVDLETQRKHTEKTHGQHINMLMDKLDDMSLLLEQFERSQKDNTAMLEGIHDFEL